MRKYLMIMIVLIMIVSCKSEDKTVNLYSDPTLVKIADLQDRRHTDSLVAYFSSDNAIYRMNAVEAFGSVQDSTVVEPISRLLLHDDDAGVRLAAAFALGQIQHVSAAPILLEATKTEQVAANKIEILNAYGKCTDKWELPQLDLADSAISAGVAWSLYRAGLRGKTDDDDNAMAMRLLDPAYSSDTRLGAAHFFSRASKNFANAESALIRSATTDKLPRVRMASALALRKIPSDSSVSTLKKIVKNDSDSRVIINAIIAMSGAEYRKVKHYLYEALGNRDDNIAIAASEVIRDWVTPDDWIEVSSLTGQVKNWRVQGNLYEGALRAGKNADLAKEIQDKFDSAPNPFAKAAYLSALKHHPKSFGFVREALQEADTAIVRSAAAATLVAMNASADFNRQLQGEFSNLYRDIVINSSDPAVLSTIASTLAKPEYGYKTLISDVSFLKDARKRLRLPEHFESIQPIDEAIAYFEGKPAAELRNEFNHPIDWNFVRTIAAGQQATIKTTRGDIVVRLFVNECPGSVANFIKLAQQDYFDNRPVHRVVPNFVIQAGCNRGDGFGSEDYSIRSEFSAVKYKTGSLGMASAGKDTEGTQWFITHSPTPHLDGRYTLFGEVTDGLSVVNYLQVGDKITDVEIENSPAQ